MGFASLIAIEITQALELEYTFESNRIEGNTMTLRETDLVINEGFFGKVCGNILKSLIIIK
jgi:fatty acid/phospholipid biosynthesis enzyme